MRQSISEPGFKDEQLFYYLLVGKSVTEAWDSAPLGNGAKGWQGVGEIALPAVSKPAFSTGKTRLIYFGEN
jgi:hypothetical protein